MARRTLLTAAGAALIAVSLVGCGQAGSPPDPTPSTPASPSAEPPAGTESARDWPAGVPRPLGEPVDGEDSPELYTVAASRSAFDSYADQVSRAPGADEILSTEQTADLRSFRIDAATVIIVFDEDAGTMSVSVE